MTENIVVSLSASLKNLNRDEAVDLYNAVMEVFEASGHFPHPSSTPRLVACELVESNDYNPNVVAPPEMKLLRHSITRDGLTMPVVVVPRNGKYTVVDGFHRTQVSKEFFLRDKKDKSESNFSHVPVSLLRKDLPDLMAATVRHNMARGVHQVALSAKLVALLTKHTWTPERIGQELGMDPDEVLRMKQTAGLASLYADREYSESWE